MNQTTAPPSSRSSYSSPSAAPRAARDHVWLRRFFVVVVVLAALVVLLRIVLDPIAAHFTRQALHEAKGIDGRFGSVHVSVLPPAYTIRDLRVIETPHGSWKDPLLDAEHVRVDLEWRKLFHGVVSAQMRVDEPKIRYTQREKVPPAKVKPKQLPNPQQELRQLIPARVDRIEVRRGDLVYRDLTAPRHPELGIHRIEMAAENVATRRRLAHGQPATLSVSALLGKSGDLSAFVSSDLFAKSLSAAGNAQLRGWKVAELYDFEEPATKLQTPQGTLDLFAEFKIKNGAISGGVKPVLKNVEVRPTQGDIGNELKAWLADTALDLFSDRVPNRNAVATVIPIEGRLDDPHVQLWPTVLSILRNAFVEGISSGFSHLPPPVAKEKQGVLSQAADALSKDSTPKAQPEGEKKGKDDQ